MTLVKLSEIVSFKTGKLNSNAAVADGKYPFFTCSQETYRTNTFAFDTECVLLGGNNANGIYPLKYFNGKFDAYQRTYIIRSVDLKVLSNRYLYYALRPQLELMRSISTGAATKFLTLTLLKNLEISTPGIEDQHRIASILSAFDDLIENNTRRIKILEEMAQRIYREWFVHFRYPGHENDQLVDSGTELGMIPEGWKPSILKEEIKNIRDSVKAGEYTQNHPYVPVDCLPRHSLVLSESKRGEEAKSSLIKFRDNDILFGAMRAYFHKVVISPFDGTTRSTCFVLRPVQTQYLEYWLLTLFQKETVEYANSHSRGSTMPYAVWNNGLGEMLYYVPPESLITKFHDIISPMLQMFKSQYFTINNLKKTRDLLLPKLISGQIDVSGLDVEMGDLS